MSSATPPPPSFPPPSQQAAPPAPKRSGGVSRPILALVAALSFFAGCGFATIGMGGDGEPAATATVTERAEPAEAVTVTEAVTEAGETVTETAAAPEPAPATEAPPAPAAGATELTDGTYVVGQDVEPGRFTTTAAETDFCSWRRLSGLSGSSDDVIEINVASGQSFFEIAPGDVAAQVDGGCTWTRVP